MPRSTPPGTAIAPQLVVRTLGAAEVTTLNAAGDRIGRFGAGKPLALLVYLSRSPNQAAPREHLVELLWGDVDLEYARHALRQTIWYIRKTLGAAVLHAEGDMVQLSAPCDSDATAFLQSVDQHDEERALALYGGEFLAGIAIPGGGEFERWADLERMRLRSIFTRTAESRVLFLLQRGEARAALPVARRARDADTGDERLWRRVLEVLIAARDALGAAAEADAFERLWHADEREPEASTRALLRRARNEVTADTPSTQDKTAAVVASLVGRVTEFASLTAAWDEVQRDGRLRHVHVSAPAGLGKTRLLSDFRSRLRGSRSRVVLVRANPGERGIPFALVAEIARHLAELPGAAAIAPETASVLVRLNPALSSLFPQAVSTAIEQEPLRRRTMALRELAAAVTDERPATLLVDDLHWADRESQAVLAACADNCGGARLLLVTSSRGAARQFFADELQEVVLPPLDPRAVTEFIASLGELPDHVWADRLPLLLTGATAGSPLLVLETMQLAMERGLLTLDDGRWQCTDSEMLERLLISTDPLASRIGRLDDESGRLLALVSAAGVPCSTATLGAAASMASEHTARELHALEVRGLVMQADAGWMPAHDEIAASVLTTLGDEAAHRARLAVARALAAKGDADLGTLRVAAELLLTAGEIGELSELFARFTRTRERAGIDASAREHLHALLGETLSPAHRRRLLRAAPWRTRFTRGQMAVAAIVLLSLPVGAWWRTERSAHVAVHLQGVETDAKVVAPMTLELSPSIDMEHETLELSSHTHSLSLPEHGGSYSLDPAPDGTGWYASQTFGDEGGDDPVFVPREGTVRRIFQSPGDDNVSSVSPDGGRLAISTSRFSSRMYAAAAIVDLRSGQVTQVLKDGSKTTPIAWSPDGTHLLIARTDDNERDYTSSTCIAGANTRLDGCFPGWSAYGWASNAAILVRRRPNSEALARLDVATGRVQELCDHVRTVSISPDYLWAVVRGERPGVDGPVFWLARTDEPCRGPVLTYDGTPVRATTLTWDVLRPTTRWLDRLKLKAPDTLTSVAPVLLWAAGTAPDGSSLQPTNLEWRSLDTTVAMVTTGGLLIPRANGVARIVASAGGWRADTATVRVVRRPARQLLRTVFGSKTALADWIAFGWPRPVLTPLDGQMVLSLNGDSSYGSGVRLRRTIRVDEGVTVRVRARMQITADQWQNLSLSLHTAAPDSLWQRWDLVTGSTPKPVASSLACQINFPSGEGASNRDFVTIGDLAGQYSFDAPASLRAGTWEWFEIQVLPDGRCGGGIANEPVRLWADRQPIARPLELILSSNAYGTRALIDTVEVYAGVLHPAWWTALDARRLEAGTLGLPGDGDAPTVPPAPGRSSRPSTAGAARGPAAPPAAPPRGAGTRPVPPH